MGNAHILAYYPIISYQGIEVYRIETMCMGRLFWNNAVGVKWNTSKYFSTYLTGKDIFVRVIWCGNIPRFWRINDTSLAHWIICWFMYDSYEVVCNVYGEILSHKLNKRTHFGGYILCLAYYGILIRSSDDLFIIAHNFRIRIIQHMEEVLLQWYCCGFINTWKITTLVL